MHTGISESIICMQSHVSLLMSKDLLMHQPYSNYPDHAVVKNKLCFIMHVLDHRIRSTEAG